MAKHKQTTLFARDTIFWSRIVSIMLICYFARWAGFSMEDYGRQISLFVMWEIEGEMWFCPRMLIFLPHDLDNWWSKSTKHLKHNASNPMVSTFWLSFNNRHRTLLPLLKSWMEGLHMHNYAIGPMMIWKQLIPAGKS